MWDGSGQGKTRASLLPPGTWPTAKGMLSLWTSSSLPGLLPPETGPSRERSKPYVGRAEDSAERKVDLPGGWGPGVRIGLPCPGTGEGYFI
jgi:hypothetical protein